MKSIATAPARKLNTDNQKREAQAKKEKDAYHQTKTLETPIYKAPNEENPTYAISLMRRREFKQALTILEKCLKKNPKNPEFLSLKGDCLFQLSKFKEAKDAYIASRNLNPSYYPAFLGIGIVTLNIAKQNEQQGKTQLALDNYTESLKLLREANKILPNNLTASYGRAHAAAGIGNYYYQRALNLKRIRNDLQGAETMCDKAINLYKEAISYGTNYSSQYRKQVGARIFLAIIHYRSGTLFKEFSQRQMAKIAFNNSILTWKSVLREIDPNNTQAKSEIKKCEKILQGL